MSMHRIPLTDLERAGLERHGLDIGTSSQLSDAFRQGIAWALSQASAEPSAPVEIDEHQAFIEACRQAALAKGREIDPQALEQRLDGSYVNPLTECGWWGGRARAALDRKP